MDRVVVPTSPTYSVGGQGEQKQKNSYLEQQELRDVLLEIGRVLLMTQIYKLSHPIVQRKISSLSPQVIKVIDKYGRMVLSNREDVFFLNGYQERVSQGPLRKLADTFKSLKVSSFEFEKGITEQEINSFFALIVAQKTAKVTLEIKEQLKSKGLTHIRPIFLQYIEVDDIPKDVPEPKNVNVEVIQGFKKFRGPVPEEQIINDFLKGKIEELPKKVNTFLLNHPKLSAMIIVKLIDEYEDQNLDSFAAFQAFVQSLSHYMARLSRLIKNPDQVAKTLEKLEKHLVARLKSLKKDRKYIYETRRQINDALSWVAAEQMLAHFEKAKENLWREEQSIIDAIEKKKVPSIKEFKERLRELGVFQSKLTAYLS